MIFKSLLFKVRKAKLLSLKLSPEKHVVIDNVAVQQQSSTSFLGVTLQSDLKWTSHVTKVRSKVAKAVGILCKASKSFKPYVLLSLYNSLVYPHFTYCIEIWGAATTTDLNMLFKLQKRAVRIITLSPFLAHTKELFCKLKLLTLKQIYIYCSLCLMFKIFQKSVPPVVFSRFAMYQNQYNTRRKNCFQLPFTRREYIRKTFRHSGISLWNYNVKHLHVHENLFVFKHELRTAILSNVISPL